MKKCTMIITLRLSAIFIILLYNNLSNDGSASYRMADITSSNDRSHGKQTQHDPESTYKVEVQYRMASSILDGIKVYLKLQ
ncbi:hypothetical protein J14TS5_55340 [Paenibacillus lautus]|nr:hypothetical protein J14TS5_55340 [Paenibacillus lautus]